MVPSYRSFVCALTLSGYTAFMFGWHVHEKAIMLVLVPFSLIAADSHAHFRTFLIANVAGIFSLFPLVFTVAETPVKIIYSLIWVAVVLNGLGRRVYQYPSSKLSVIVDFLEKAYLAGFVVLQASTSLYPLLTSRTAVAPPDVEVSLGDPTAMKVDVVGSSTQLEFLPLMLTSVYCAVGLVWAFIRLGFLYIRTY